MLVACDRPLNILQQLRTSSCRKAHVDDIIPPISLAANFFESAMLLMPQRSHVGQIHISSDAEKGVALPRITIFRLFHFNQVLWHYQSS